MEPRKEERRDELSGPSEFAATIPAPGQEGSEKFSYKIVTVDKATEEFGRFDRYKHQLGYEVAKKVGRQVVMGRPKEDRERDLKAMGKRSEGNVVTEGNQDKEEKDGSRTSTSVSVQKGGFPDD